MNILMNLSWLGKSVMAMFCILPMMLAFNFFGKNYGVKPEAVMFAWFAGIIIGIVFSSFRYEFFEVKNLYTPLLPILFILLLGIVIGTPGNILLAYATTGAPNPALPFTIVNSGSAIAYMLAAGLAVLLPQYFDKMEFSLINIAGIAMVVFGMGLLMYKNS